MPVASCPLNSTRPEVGNSSPPRIRNSVVLPEPDGPSSATSAPPGIDSDTGCSAAVVRGLADAGVLEPVLLHPTRNIPAPDWRLPGPVLSPEQAAALAIALCLAPIAGLGGAAVARTISVPENISLQGRDDALFAMVERMMTELNAKLEEGVYGNLSAVTLR